MANNSASSFFSTYFHFNKPAAFENRLPSCVNLTNFYENNHSKLDEVLPYISYGGIVHFDRNVDLDVVTGDYFICCYISEGRIQIQSSKEDYICEEQTVFMAYKNFKYNLKTLSKDTTIYAYFVSGLVVDSYFNSIMKRPESRYSFHKDFDMHSFIINSLSKLDYLLTDEATTSLYTQSLIFQYVFVRLLSVQSSSDIWEQNAPTHIIRLKKIFDTRYEENHTLDSLQEELGINKYRLCRDFSSAFNIAPLKYLNTVRMDKAKQLLLDTDYTIVEIGNAVGIANTTHFINQFKKETGDTPLKYRQHHVTLGDSIPGPFQF